MLCSFNTVKSNRALEVYNVNVGKVSFKNEI